MKPFLLCLALLLSGCSPLRHYEFASHPGQANDSSAGDITHASEPGARVVVPKSYLRAASRSQAMHCGIERQLVKTLQDKDRLRVNTTPLDATIAVFNGYNVPLRHDLMAAEDYRIAPYELQVWRVTGYLVGFKLEADEDFHIVLADIADPKLTMVVEIPSEQCMPGEGTLQRSWQERFGKATVKFKRVAVHKIKVQVTGYGFFDVIHGQTGVAKSGFELHPLISWKEVQ